MSPWALPLSWSSCFLHSSPSAEHPWVDNTPKTTLTLLGTSRPAGGLIGANDFTNLDKSGPGHPHFPPTDLPGSFHSHELPLAELPGVLSVQSGQAPRCFGSATLSSGLSSREDPGALMANSHQACPPPGPSRPPAAVADNGFLPHNFLVAPTHGGQHGSSLPGQPPLPEKKRASEGDRSLGSVSPSSSGFSSPHSGSTMSIPFPNILPDFSKGPEAAAPSSGRWWGRSSSVQRVQGVQHVGQQVSHVLLGWTPEWRIWKQQGLLPVNSEQTPSLEFLACAYWLFHFLMSVRLLQKQKMQIRLICVLLRNFL